MSAKKRTISGRQIFISVGVIIGLLLSVNSYGQLGISGPTSVTLNTPTTYTPTFNGSSTWVYNGSYGYTITGGVVTGTSNTTKSGTNSGVLYSMAISVTWTSSTGSLFLACGLGTKTINVSVVQPLSAGTLSPSSQTINYNTTPSTITGTAASGGAASPSYQYQWWYSTDAVNWNTIGGATGLNYSPGNLTATTYYKRQVTETTTSTSAYTSYVTVTVYPQVAVNITPLSQTIISGQSATTLTANPSGGNGSYTYLWESSPNNSTWSSVGTSSTYSPGVLTSTWFYRVTATSNTVSATSSTATVSVCPSATTVGPITGSSTCMTGSTVQLSNSVGGGTWSSSNTTVATVDANGVVYGKLDGTVTITYTLTNSCGTASAQLTVNVVSFAAVSQTVGQGIPDPVMIDTISLVQGTIKTRVFDQDTLYSTAHTIQNIIAFRVIEESNKYIPGDFNATAVLKVEYGHSLTDIYQVDSIKLYVNYTKNGGNKYNALNYFTYKNAEFTRITVIRIEAPTTVNGNSFDTKQVLMLTNMLAATRFYKLADNKKPVLSYTNPSPDTIPDALQVGWTFPAHANNNGVQLEWTWLENEMAGSYIINNVFDTSLLFKTGATRIDLSGGATVGGYDIPLLYSGVGKVFMRVRGVNRLPSGSRSDGPWSGVQTYAFNGHNDSLNWQASTQYAQEGKRKTILQYSDGSLRVRQMVTKDNVTQRTTVAETIYDGEGRPAVQILPAPGIGNILSYTKNLNKFNTQADNTDPTDFFDFNTPALGKYATTALSENSGSARYYSNQNPDANSGINKNIPAANGFPYAVTRYTPDGTGRIMRQGGVGDSLQIGGNHAIKYFYGSPAKEELDALFGTEVGNASHYFKTMIQDANGQMTVKYADMHGRTVATALAGEAPVGIQALNITDTNQYKNQAGKILNRNLLDKSSNILKGNSIESVNSVLVPFPTSYTFDYTLTKQTLTLPKCGGGTVSYDCKFDLQISVSDESGDNSPVVYNFTGIDNLTFNQALVLQAGSYSVRKTLTINLDSLDKFMAAYNTVNVGLCQTQQYLVDSIAAQDSTASGCGITTPPLTANTCTASLGTFPTYLSNYATSLGYANVNQLSAQQVNDIRNQYLSDSSFCVSLNGNVSHTLENIRKQMLSDMVPYSGQYGRDTGTTAMYNKYNVFSTAGTSSYTQPLFKYPRLLPGGSPDYYYTPFGNIDSSVLLPRLQTMSMTDFEQEFKDSWTKSLLPYHPEFKKLKYAEDTLRSVFNYMDSVTGVVTTAFNPINSDPFFSTFSTGADKNLIKKYSDTAWMGTYSMWQLAYAEAFGCKAMLDTANRRNCFNNMPKVLSSTGTTVNNGIGNVTLTISVQGRAWSTYKAFYNQARADMVSRYINVHPGVVDTADNTNLINYGFRIYFPYNNVQQSQNLGWTGWYPNNAGVYPPVNLTDSVNNTTSSRCDSYINAWRNALLDCPALLAKDSATREAILNSIMGKLVVICKYGTDDSNPYGSSTVPSYVSTPYTSFEDAVYFVLDSAGISKNLYCHPYGIEWPKPYGKNPLITKQEIGSVDNCTCSQFYKLQTAAYAAGKDPYSLTSMNQYLLSKYQDTLTAVLWQGLQQCGNTFLYNCRDTVISTCGHPGAYYSCTIRICDTLKAYPLVTPQPLPYFLVCGFDSTQVGCFSCSTFTALQTSFNTLFGHYPYFIGSNPADSVIAWNDLFAKYVNFKTGLQHTWQYYAQKFGETGCAVGGYDGSGAGLSICLDKKPITDTTGFTTTITPCQRVRNQATIKAALVYENIRQQLMANFKTAYVNQCVAAAETFKVTDTLKEYHYTLFYYDEAGNLVKTVTPKGVNPIYRQTWIDSVENFRILGLQLTPKHSLVTRSCYNSINKVVLQKSPDGGVNKYYYDWQGRLTVSQNARQAQQGNVYSYTKYDSLGRLTETGQITGTSAMSDATARSASSLQTWFVAAASARNQITQVVYDTAYAPINGITLSQKNLRNRVSYSQVINNATDAFPASATYYSYDIHGKVDTLLQDYGNSTGISNAMNSSGNRFKTVVYNYDVISGSVTQVSYQPGKADAYYHRYAYDAVNRLTDVYSGRDSVMLFYFSEREAHYTYSQNGLLSRTDVGQLRVQGVDFAYTLQGWLKGVNPAMGGTLTNGTDTTEANPVAQDVYAFSLNYYKNDYKAIGYTPQSTSIMGALASNGAALFDGNIAAMAVNIPKVGSTKVNSYHYDQMYRMVAMDTYNGLTPAAGTFTPTNISDYRERVLYDPNGNILSYNRHGDAARLAMDSMSYFYNPNTNQLHKVTDAASDALPADYSKYYDLKQGQSDNNYTYDATGNLISDNAEGITNISWTVYGKVSSITKSGVLIKYVYDAAGNRIMKYTAADTTVYVRDANGIVLSIYTKSSGGVIAQAETGIYGRGHLGMATSHVAPDTAVVLSGDFGTAVKCIFTRGEKLFQMTNHLGNVLVTINDRKIQYSAGGVVVDYYAADVVTANDYYPYGMTLPGRSYNAQAYRYAFNGQERSMEVQFNTFTAEYWEYDTRTGRRWNLDPVLKIWESPYATFSDNPILYSDPNGDVSGEGPGPVTPNNQALKLPSYAKVTKSNATANNGTVHGSDCVTALSVAGSVEEFTIGDRVYTAKYNTTTGEFTRYADQNGKTYDVNQYFKIETHKADIWTRVGGFFQGVGGLFEMAGGGTIIVGSEGVGTVPGWLIVAHGADNTAAGFTTMWTGDATETFTEIGLQELGMSPQGAAMTNGLITTATTAGTAPGGQFNSGGASPLLKTTIAVEIPLQATAQAAKSENVIALSVKEELDDFAKQVGGTTWEQWGKADFVRDFQAIIMDPGTKICFNLNRLESIWGAAQKGAQGIGGGYTNWELFMIKTHPDTWSRTTFYLDGKVIPNPFQ